MAASLITTLREAVPSNSHPVPTSVLDKVSRQTPRDLLTVMAGEGLGKEGTYRWTVPGFPEPALAALLSDTEKVISRPQLVSFPEK